MDMDVYNDLPHLPDREAGGHKGTFGTVIVVGGHGTMIGAPAMTAHAAYRSGAGLVKVAVSAKVLPHVIVIEPSVVGVELTGSAEEEVAAIERADEKGEAVLAIGPGLGKGDRQTDLVTRLLRGSRKLVLDADGLNALASTGEPAPINDASPSRVFTPHPGEFRRLAEPLGIEHDPTDREQRPTAAAALARAHRAVVLLKGEQPVVSDGEQQWVAPLGSPLLGAAGTGDTLTGCVAAMLAQGAEAFDAARLAVAAGQLAARQWEIQHGSSGMLARELADGLPAAMQAMRT